MNELIKVTEQNGKQAVSARELHQFLEVKSKLFDWVKNQAERAMLIENEDYQRVTIFLDTPGGKQQATDFAISINAAKEIAMLNGGEKGKQARRYFIEIEKKYKQQVQPMNQLEFMEMSLKLMREQFNNFKQIEQRVTEIEKQPVVNADIQHFSIMGYCRNIGKQISLNEAKDYGIKCSRMCTQLGFQTGKVPDPRFGTVKTYPLSELVEILGGQ